MAFFIFKSLTTNQLKADNCPVSHGAFYPLSVFTTLRWKIFPASLNPFERQRGQE
ncbi:MAG: hypothetical protein OJF51_004420 [Nitrospira sp.]|nr:MAG: hypothetical protein OJF51_004420 [Nitrospira sp.]